MQEKRTIILISFIVGLALGLLSAEHKFSWTLGMLLSFGAFWMGLGIFVGWRIDKPEWLKKAES